MLLRLKKEISLMLGCENVPVWASMRDFVLVSDGTI